MVKTPFPTHSHLYPLLALVAFVLAAFGCSDDSPSGPPPNVFPGEPTVITEGPATLSLPAGDHLVLDGQGASPFRVDVEIGRNDAEVPIDEGESLVSEIITIRHDQAGPLPIASDDDSDPFARLTLAFDPTLLPEDETPDDLNTVVVARYPTESEGTGGPEHTEMATARAVGDIDAEAGTIEIAISLLPQRMDLAVVYAPDLVSLAET
ncbi:MAG: hypothetical protein JW797_20505, partial [Bradymonadales bacterium]|nr:hypothetical protein [Bradymonadales bacterium]